MRQEDAARHRAMDGDGRHRAMDGDGRHRAMDGATHAGARQGGATQGGRLAGEYVGRSPFRGTLIRALPGIVGQVRMHGGAQGQAGTDGLLD